MENDRIQWIEYKGKEILYCDYRDLDENGIAELIKQIEQTVISSGKKNILKINDIRGLFVMASILPLLQKTAIKQKPYIGKNAYVGSKGMKKLVDAVNEMTKIGAKSFDTVEEAKEWTVK